MLTKENRETYGNLPESAKTTILALSVLIDRIGSLPKADRDDLFELLQEWRKTDDDDERRSIQRAMEEVLAQIPATSKPMPLAGAPSMTRGLKSWAEHVARKI